MLQVLFQIFFNWTEINLIMRTRLRQGSSRVTKVTLVFQKVFWHFDKYEAYRIIINLYFHIKIALKPGCTRDDQKPHCRESYIKVKLNLFD